MKNTIIILFLSFISLSAMKAQTDTLSSVTILHEDSTLLLNNNDTSYVFNAFVLTQTLNGINSVTLTCENYSVNTWSQVQDTVYTWSAVTATLLANPVTSYGICKPNDNMLMICLGRRYYANRHRFRFITSGNNGILIKEFVF